MVNYPISFFPIALRHQADVPEVEDRRHKVALAVERQFYHTAVIEPVYIPDVKNAEGYLRNYGIGRYPVQRVRADMMWQQAIQRYSRRNALHDMSDLRKLTDSQLRVIYSDWYQAKCRELQDTDSSLAPYFLSREVREAHEFRVEAARRATMPMRDEVVAPTVVQAKVVQQQPIQHAFVDGLGEFEWDDYVPDFDVLGCAV